MKKDRIGSIGWCMGGKYSLQLADEEPTLAAAVVYYGATPTKAEDIARIKAPVLGNFGGDDQGPAPDQVKAFEAAMKAAGKSDRREDLRRRRPRLRERQQPLGRLPRGGGQGRRRANERVLREAPEEVGRLLR